MTVWVFLVRMSYDDIRSVCLPIFSIYSCAILSMKSSVIRSLSLGENPSEMCPHGSLILDLVSVNPSKRRLEITKNLRNRLDFRDFLHFDILSCEPMRKPGCIVVTN